MKTGQIAPLNDQGDIVLLDRDNMNQKQVDLPAANKALTNANRLLILSNEHLYRADLRDEFRDTMRQYGQAIGSDTYAVDTDPVQASTRTNPNPSKPSVAMSRCCDFKEDIATLLHNHPELLTRIHDLGAAQVAACQAEIEQLRRSITALDQKARAEQDDLRKSVTRLEKDEISLKAKLRSVENSTDMYGSILVFILVAVVPLLVLYLCFA